MYPAPRASARNTNPAAVPALQPHITLGEEGHTSTIGPLVEHDVVAAEENSPSPKTFNCPQSTSIRTFTRFRTGGKGVPISEPARTS